MKIILPLLLAVLTAAAPVKESPSVPARRATEYPWMSVAAWNARHAELASRAKRGEVDVLFLGDSITERWAGTETWRRRWEPLKAANFGIGGDTVQNVLWRVADGELDGLSPKVVVLMIGTNNFSLRDDAPKDVARGVAAVVTRLRRSLPKTKVLLLGILPRGEKAADPLRAAIRTTNARIARLDDGKRVRFLDFGPRLLEADGTLSKDVAPDFLHISERGYAIWADAMDPPLRELLAAP